jgi:4-amino-4-deoxy-L-arabinose transferase-like glycosyltransferase
MTPQLPDNTQVAPLMLIAFALVMAFVGQSQFSTQDDVLWQGLLCFVVAIASLLAAEWLLWRRRASAPAVPTAADKAADQADAARPRRLSVGGMSAHRVRWLLTGAALLLTIRVFHVLSTTPQTFQETGPLLSWLVACILMIAAWIDIPSVRQIRAWIWQYRGEIAAVGLLTLAALALRLWNLAEAPFTVSGDEGTIGQDMKRMLTGEIINPFLLLPLSSISYMAEAVSPLLFGLDTWSLRLPHAIFGTLAIPAVYLLARVLFNRQVALVAALLLAGYVLHLHYSRVAIKVIYDTFFYSVTLAALAYGLKQRSGPFPFVLAGVLAGLAQHANVGARLLPIVMVAFVIYLAIFARDWLRGQWVNLLLMVTTFVIVIPSILVYAIQHPDIYNSRLNQVGIIQNGWLEREQEFHDTSAPVILAEQLKFTLFGFMFYRDRTVSYGGSPLANPAMSLLLFLGLGLGLLFWWKKPPFALLMLWFWGGLLGGGVLTIGPPTSNRLVMLTPVVALLAAVALVEVVRLLFATFGAQHRQFVLAVVACVLALPIAVYDVRFYFNEYIPENYFGGNEAQIATILGYELQDQSPQPHLYFYGAPQMWSGFSTLVLLAPDLPRTDIEQPLESPQALDELVQQTNPDAERDALFVVLPHRMDQLDVIQQQYPGGTLLEVGSTDGEKLLFYSYRVPREQLQAQSEA